MAYHVKLDTIIRTIVLLLALANQALTIAGINVLPISDEQIRELVSLLFTVGSSLWAWWKNNSFTQAALAGDEVKNSIKANKEV